MTLISSAAAVIAAAAVAAAVAVAAPAYGAPTCTAGDLATRQGFQCSLAPGLGVTPGASCPVWTVPDYGRDPFVVRSQCRPPAY
jgi:hypothetical protein